MGLANIVARIRTNIVAGSRKTLGGVASFIDSNGNKCEDDQNSGGNKSIFHFLNIRRERPSFGIVVKREGTKANFPQCHTQSLQSFANYGKVLLADIALFVYIAGS